MNNYTDAQYLLTLEGLAQVVTYAIVGKEIGEEEKTPHLQGYVQLKKKTRFTTIKKWWETNVDGAKPHIEVARGSAESNVTYCSKDDVAPWVYGEIVKRGERVDISEFLKKAKTMKERDLADMFPNEYAKYWKAAERIRNMEQQYVAEQELANEYKECVLQEWQVQVLAELADQDGRQILWVWEETGNVGKSWLARYLVCKQDAFYIQCGKAGDIAHAYGNQKVVVYDLTRSQEEFVNYTTMESFKNGMMFSPKYESKTKKFGSCKVIVFANWPPRQNALSLDRWNIVQLGAP